MKKDTALLTPETLLAQWEGHRRLTRRTIDAFPDDRLFSFRPAPPMRSFGEMMLEVLSVLEPNLHGFLTGEWVWTERYAEVCTKVDLLSAWDESTDRLRDAWPHLPAERLLEVEPGYFYGGPPQPHLDRVLYFMDNEIHHRAQGFVYLRLLGLEPPSFFDR